LSVGNTLTGLFFFLLPVTKKTIKIYKKTLHAPPELDTAEKEAMLTPDGLAMPCRFATDGTVEDVDRGWAHRLAARRTGVLRPHNHNLGGLGRSALGRRWGRRGLHRRACLR